MGNLSAAYGEAACKSGSEVLGFPDMTVTEIRHRASLPGTQAELAKQREYDEPFEILGSKIHTLLAAIERRENAGLHEYRRKIKLCCIVPVRANVDGQNGSGILIIHLG